MALKVTLFRPSFCFFALYLPFYEIYNYILLFPVSLVIIIIVIMVYLQYSNKREALTTVNTIFTIKKSNYLKY